MKCEICGHSTKSYQGLSKHINTVHNVKPKDYYDKYMKPPNTGICICGKSTPFLNLGKGYQKHCCAKCAQLDPNTQNKFRVSNPQKDKIIRAKTIATCNEKYGGVGFKSQLIQEKAIQTRLDKYGVTNSYQIPHIAEKAAINSHSTIAKQKRLKSQEQAVEQYAKEHDLVYIETAFNLNKSCGWLYDIDIVVYKNRRLIKRSDLDYIKRFKTTNQSSSERRLVSMIRDNYNGKIVTNSRKIISPNELDVYLPDLKLAIEFNGSYYHAIENGTDIDYHLKKSISCRDKGIRLIHIYEFEDFTTQLNLLKSLLHGVDKYPITDFNKNNLITKVPKPTIVYSDGRLTIYGAGKLVKEENYT